MERKALTGWDLATYRTETGGFSNAVGAWARETNERLCGFAPSKQASEPAGETSERTRDSERVAMAASLALAVCRT